MSMAVQVLMMILAAVFEVSGDALIKRGITGGGLVLIAIGFIVLGSYGVIVNLIGLDFSRMLGAYVGWFAVISMLFGRFLFGDRLNLTTCLGLALVLSGSLVILSGSRSSAAGAPKATVVNVR